MGNRVSITEEYFFGLSPEGCGRGLTIFKDDSVKYGPNTDFPVKVTVEQIEEIFFRVKDLELYDSNITVSVNVKTPNNDITCTSSYKITGSDSEKKAQASGNYFKCRPLCYQYYSSKEKDDEVRNKLYVKSKPYVTGAKRGDTPDSGFQGTDKFMDVGLSDETENDECCLFSSWYPDNVEESFSDVYGRNKDKGLVYYSDQIFFDGTITIPSYKALTATLEFSGSEPRPESRPSCITHNLKIGNRILKVGGTDEDPFSGDLYLNIVHQGYNTNAFGYAFNIDSTYLSNVQVVLLAGFILELDSGNIQFPLYYNRSGNRTVSGSGEIRFKPKYWAYKTVSGAPVWDKDTGKLLQPNSIG